MTMLTKPPISANTRPGQRSWTPLEAEWPTVVWSYSTTLAPPMPPERTRSRTNVAMFALSRSAFSCQAMRSRCDLRRKIRCSNVPASRKVMAYGRVGSRYGPRPTRPGSWTCAAARLPTSSNDTHLHALAHLGNPALSTGAAAAPTASQSASSTGCSLTTAPASAPGSASKGCAAAETTSPASNSSTVPSPRSPPAGLSQPRAFHPRLPCALRHPHAEFRRISRTPGHRSP